MESKQDIFTMFMV